MAITNSMGKSPRRVRKIDVKVAETLSTLAQKGAALGNLGRMCDSCAFKKGSVTNSSEPHNTAKALECLAYFGEFNCHKRDEDGKLQDKGNPCIGYKYAQQYLKSRVGE